MEIYAHSHTEEHFPRHSILEQSLQMYQYVMGQWLFKGVPRYSVPIDTQYICGSWSKLSPPISPPMTPT